MRRMERIVVTILFVRGLCFMTRLFCSPLRRRDEGGRLIEVVSPPVTGWQGLFSSSNRR